MIAVLLGYHKSNKYVSDTSRSKEKAFHAALKHFLRICTYAAHIKVFVHF